MPAVPLGDIRAGQIIYFTWDTNDGNGGSINPTIAGTISVYKDDNIAQSVAGITDVRVFDGLVGLHNCTIDTADAFYASGHDYHVVLSACTIDGQVVNATLAEFSIENRFNPNQSKFYRRLFIQAVAPVVAQGIDAIMVAKGCIEYERVLVSYTYNWAAPDDTYDLLYYYDANRRVYMISV